MRFEGKTALVTGGASGLGHATVRALYDAGANVVVLDLPTSQGAAFASELGGRARFAPADVTSPEDVTAAVAIAVEAFGGVHVAVNCAGIAWAGRTVGRNGPHDLGVFESVLRVNVVGSFNVIRLAAQQMASQEPDGEERGVIVNTASIAAFDGQVGQAAYAASKRRHRLADPAGGPGPGTVSDPVRGHRAGDLRDADDGPAPSAGPGAARTRHAPPGPPRTA